MKNGTGWGDYYWYKPGDNTPTHKQAFVEPRTAVNNTRDLSLSSSTSIVQANLALRRSTRLAKRTNPADKHEIQAMKCDSHGAWEPE